MYKVILSIINNTPPKQDVEVSLSYIAVLVNGNGEVLKNPFFPFFSPHLQIFKQLVVYKPLLNNCLLFHIQKKKETVAGKFLCPASYTKLQDEL
jgi:hypothetical protein